VEEMGLPTSIQAPVTSTVKENRMLWEPWIESASDYAALKKSLESRGFRGIPAYSMPKHMPLPGIEMPQMKAPVEARTTMLRKAKN
jgi:hypothetical protein